MSDRPVLEPTAAHPITITPTAGRVTVRVGGRVVAESDRALSLAEATIPVVQYLPLEDVDASVLRESATQSYCPYKGDASYYSVEVDGRRIDDLIWTYREPYDAVGDIAGLVAFWASRGAQVTVD